MCDMSATSDLLDLYRSFLDQLLLQLPISHSSVRVAMVRFISPPEVTWNLTSDYSYNYTTVMQGVHTYLSSTISPPASVDDAIGVVINDVIMSPDNRADAPNVVLLLGTGENTVFSMVNLEQMRLHGRMLAVNMHATSEWLVTPAFSPLDSFRYASDSGEYACTLQKVLDAIQSLFPCDV